MKPKQTPSTSYHSYFGVISVKIKIRCIIPLHLTMELKDRSSIDLNMCEILALALTMKVLANGIAISNVLRRKVTVE